MMRATIAARPGGAATGGLDQVDFGKPERFVKEILEFLSNVTITNDINM